MPDPTVDLNKYFSSKIGLFRNNREMGPNGQTMERKLMDCSLRAQRATRAKSTPCWPLGVISDATFPTSWCFGACKATGAHTSAWLLSAGLGTGWSSNLLPGLGFCQLPSSETGLETGKPQGLQCPLPAPLPPPPWLAPHLAKASTPRLLQLLAMGPLNTFLMSKFFVMQVMCAHCRNIRKHRKAK